MRKSVITLLFTSFFIIITVNAETLPLCQAFLKMEKSSENKFSDLKLDKKPGSSLFSYYNTTIQVENADSSYIDDGLFSCKFVSALGKFDSKYSAENQLNASAAIFKKCFTNVDFVNFEGLFNKTYYNIITKSEDGLRYYDAGFRIEKSGDWYILSFECKGAESSGFGANATVKKVYTDYFKHDEQKEYGTFTSDIQKIINESASLFENWKGAELESDFFLFKWFESSFSPAGFPGSFIEDRGMDVVRFVIPVEKGIDENSIDTKEDEVFLKMKRVLGPDYLYNFSSDYMVINFVHKDHPDHVVAYVQLEYKSGLYNISIYITGDK